jgi:hypothetical protein
MFLGFLLSQYTRDSMNSSHFIRSAGPAGVHSTPSGCRPHSELFIVAFGASYTLLKLIFSSCVPPPTMMMRLLSLVCVSLIVLTQGQQYQEYADQEYANDNLYHDYAMRQQEKDVGKS